MTEKLVNKLMQTKFMQKEWAQKKWVRELLELAAMFLVFMAIYKFVITVFICENYKVDGSSMQPTLLGNERVFVNKLQYRFADLKVGDVVIVDPKNLPNTTVEQKQNSWIKRIVAVAGDRVAVVQGKVHVNGKEIQEDFVRFWDSESKAETIIPEGSVYVMGDNRRHSHDSRRVGPIKNEDIKGRAEFVYWPFDKRWGWLK